MVFQQIRNSREHIMNLATPMACVKPKDWTRGRSQKPKTCFCENSIAKDIGMVGTMDTRTGTQTMGDHPPKQLSDFKNKR